MNYYCVFVETGKESAFKAEAERKLANGEFGFAGSVLVFKQIKKIVKRGKLYEELLFPGYVFLKTPEDNAALFRPLSRLPGFIKFLPNSKEIEKLGGKDLDLVSTLEFGGETQGFLRVTFDENDRIVIHSGPFAGVHGRVVSVNRRNHKLNLSIVTNFGAKIMNLSYFDVEKEDWSEEEREFIRKQG